MGLLPFYTYISHQLTGHIGLSINVANGNLVVQSNDLHISGTGLDFSVASYYNSLAPTSGLCYLNTPWSVDPLDVFLRPDSGFVTLCGQSGYSATFVQSGSSYSDAPGLDATLVKQGDGTFRLTFHATSDVYTFSAGGKLTQVTDQNGNHLSFSIGSQSAVTDTQGRVTSFTGSNGVYTSLTDPSGRTVKYTSGAGTFTLTDLAGKVTTFTYAPGTKLIATISDPLSQQTTLTYDENNRVASITDGTLAKTTFAYDTTKMTTTVTDANGHATTYYWDSQGRVTKIVDALGHSRTFSFSSDNKPSQTTDPLNTQTSYSYDANNNLTQAQNTGTSETVSYGYSDSSHPFFPTSQIDAQSHHLAYTYDSNGNLEFVDDNTLGGYGQLAQYIYNPNGTLKQMNVGGSVTSFGYDTHGNQTSITHPSPLGGESFSYDSLSRVSTSTDGLQQQTSYTYDALDRVTKLTYAGGTTVSYVYDDNGNLSSMTDPTGTTGYTYDKDNRVLTKTLPGGTQLSYSYDPVGKLLTFTDGGGQVSYGYNQVNELVTLTEPGGARTTFGYDAKGQRISTSYPNGVVMGMGYDRAGHLTSIGAAKGSTTLVRFFYQYGSAGLAFDSFDLAGNTTNYTYDTLNRLREVAVSHGTTQVNDFKYKYDNPGNLTSATLGIGATPTTYTYNAANELTSSTQGSTTTTYSYDADGNLSGWSSGGLSFSYNTLNQTTAISGNNYSYSGSDQTDRVQAGSTSYVYSFNGLSSQSDSSGTTYYTRCSCAKGTLIDERTPSGAYYYLFDGQGSIVGLTDSNGTLVSTYQYDPYGNLTSSTGSVTNPWRFAGGYFDSSTGLYKFGTRYYNPGFGRWSQQDPLRGQLKDPTSLNRYVYAGDDPVNFTDPSGKSDERVCVHLSQLQLEAFALALLGMAGWYSILAVIAGATGVGLALTVLLGAVSAFLLVWGGVLLWYVQTFLPNGFTFCFIVPPWN